MQEVFYPLEPLSIPYAHIFERPRAPKVQQKVFRELANLRPGRAFQRVMERRRGREDGREFKSEQGAGKCASKLAGSG
jgi:hypothetical protein